MALDLSYTISNPSSLSWILLAALGGVGALTIALAFRKGVGWVKKMKGYFVTMLMIGFFLIGLGVALFSIASTPTEITVDPGYLSIQSPSYFGPGNVNITKGEITHAYVSQIGSGNLSLSKQYGTNAGDLNVGVFTLGNGATANVVSNNSTDLIILLNTGRYVIVGTQDTSALVSAFSQLVYPVSS